MSTEGRQENKEATSANVGQAIAKPMKCIVMPFNGLSPAEAERLALLLEELGEAQQAIGKILRHGYESYSPFDETKTTNRKALIKELGDIFAAVQLMDDAGDYWWKSILDAKLEKLMKVKQYLHHQ
jgi:NTP pyrophosphatase (non-canonical NTP hydrolase)